MGPIVWLALGAFAVGTNNFVIVGLLPAIAAETGVSVPTAGYLVTGFSLVYAIGSPLLTVATGSWRRKTAMIAALGVLIASVLATAAAHHFLGIMAARMVTALGAGLFVPMATATAAALAGPERRGKAVSIVAAGVSSATVIGVPLGNWLGAHFGWQTAFLFVAALGGIAAASIMLLVPRPPEGPSIGMRARLAVAARPAVLVGLLTTLLWSIGVCVVFSYVAPLFEALADVGPTELPGVLIIYGLASVVGSSIGGPIADRYPGSTMLMLALVGMIVSEAAFSVIGMFGAGHAALWPSVLCAAIWSLFGWAFFPAQQSALMRAAPDAAAVVISLNASALHLGVALGAAVGSTVLRLGSAVDLGWVGALILVAALGTLALPAGRSGAVPARLGAQG